ncbi:hypothetical protein ACFYVD_10510 [Rhodococcus pyridinivorans]|uniref:hypothetical protein n=1 Tax=Rhodococcus pyridinivorans TaxID=103816 RepID=UPI0036A93599
MADELDNVPPLPTPDSILGSGTRRPRITDGLSKPTVSPEFLEAIGAIQRVENPWVRQAEEDRQRWADYSEQFVRDQEETWEATRQKEQQERKERDEELALIRKQLEHSEQQVAAAEKQLWWARFAGWAGLAAAAIAAIGVVVTVVLSDTDEASAPQPVIEAPAEQAPAEIPDPPVELPDAPPAIEGPAQPTE